jgi:hypothetical protein
MTAGTLLMSSFVVLLFSMTASYGAENAVNAERAAEIVEIRNLQQQGNTISGEVVNKSRRALRNIELLVQYHWLWNNEFKPGDEPPGKAIFVTLDKELAPGASANFSLPVEVSSGQRADGYYATEVTLAGFTEVIPPSAG